MGDGLIEIEIVVVCEVSKDETQSFKKKKSFLIPIEINMAMKIELVMKIEVEMEMIFYIDDNLDLQKKNKKIKSTYLLFLSSPPPLSLPGALGWLLAPRGRSPPPARSIRRLSPEGSYRFQSGMEGTVNIKRLLVPTDR